MQSFFRFKTCGSWGHIFLSCWHVHLWHLTLKWSLANLCITRNCIIGGINRWSKNHFNECNYLCQFLVEQCQTRKGFSKYETTQAKVTAYINGHSCSNSHKTQNFKALKKGEFLLYFMKAIMSNAKWHDPWHL